MSLTFGSKSDYVPLQAADIIAYDGNKRLRNPNATERKAWTALDPDKTRISLKHYGSNNMGLLISSLRSFRERLLAAGWDGEVV
jgi:hypothetical protein